MLEADPLFIIIYFIFIYFAGFISGFFVRASISHYRRHNARKEREARQLAAAEGEPRRDGRKRSLNLLAVLLALAVVGGVIGADHVKGPLFHDVAYCLNDGGAQTTRMCTGRVPP
jgi:hypothetical protein